MSFPGGASAITGAVLLILAGEIAWLAQRFRGTGRLPRYVFTAVSGIFLVDALDGALRQSAPWMWQLPLFLAGLSHMADMVTRLRAPDAPPPEGALS